MHKCVVCGKNGEKHHIVYKSQGWLDIPINYIYLCSEHHRELEGPHKNRTIDKQYKLSMQEKLFTILYKSYYNEEELKKLLKINPYQWGIIEKELHKYTNGYKKLHIIRRLMGGKLYK